MPAKEKILKTFFITPAQDAYLKAAGIGNLSEYLRKLIAADQPEFPEDMQPYGDIERIPTRRKRK